jgi:rsbT co-antagonist protein RsbR
VLPNDQLAAAPDVEAQLRARIADLEQRLSAYERAATPNVGDAQTILNTIPVPIFVKDAEGVYRSCNDAFERYLGRTHEEIIGHTAYDIAPPELAERYHMADIALIQQGSTQVYEANVIPADGPPRDVRFHKAVFRNPEGVVAGLVGIILDITDQKRLTQELRDQQALIRAFLDALPIGVFVIDAQQLPSFANRIAHELLGTPERAEGVVSILSDRLRVAGTNQVYPLDRLPLASALRGEPGMVDDIELQTNAGRVPFRAHAVPVRDASGTIAFALLAFSDISEEKRAAAALRLREQQDQLIQAQSDALQEISTPLLTISEGVVVMPLVGAVDSRRTQQINEALLHGVSAQRAQVAIIDITGISIVDTQVANALIHAAQAVKLLGAQVVLTGIRPEVAQTLVGLSVSLESIVTRGTLQSGIAFALNSTR